MERQLDHQLDGLRGEFLRMGAAVEESIAQSILALTERSDDVAREAIASNEVIDAWEVAIEEKILALLATHQPVGRDLRLAATMMKINYDLERMNDQAVNIAERAASYGIPGAVVDGSDVFAVHEAAVEAVKRARAGQGPSLLECKTYRHHGHFEGDQQTYKDDLYMSGSQGKDSIRDFRNLVTQHGWFTSEELDAIDRDARQAVEEALAYAESSPLPQVEEVTSDVYVSYP